MSPNERYAHALCWLAGASLIFVTGCAATVGDPTATQDPQATVRDSLGAVTIQTVNAASDCSPLTCCFPAVGAGWEKQDPFEDELRCLGCETPAPYTEAAGTSQWWFYTQCAPSRQLSALVRRYSGTPYDAQFITSDCLTRHATNEGEPGAVFVKFDPTCETCVTPVAPIPPVGPIVSQ
jgi:hypothetical protein